MEKSTLNNSCMRLTELEEFKRDWTVKTSVNIIYIYKCASLEYFLICLIVCE